MPKDSRPTQAPPPSPARAAKTAPPPTDNTRSVTRRKVKNNRLNAAGYTWAFSALTASPGARAHYDRRKDAGDRHAAPRRTLFGRLLGCLPHCLLTGQHYDEAPAFPAATKKISQ